jgi:DNA gyrase/topoisomerase IV subunit A
VSRRRELPDVRDGLTRLERVILWQLAELQRETPGRGVASAALYGRVVQHVDVSVAEFQATVARMVRTQRARRPATAGRED